jgi:tetratricopeptide (TPR) repeat protein
MKKHFGAWLFVFCFTAQVFADAPTLKEARSYWLKGSYEEARTQYEKLAKGPKSKVAAAIGLSRVDQSQGNYDAALTTVETALKDNSKNADLLARRAELLHFTGRWEDAEKAANAALAADKNHLPARWVLIQVYRDRGDHKKADAEARWIVRYYSDRSEKVDDIKDPDELLIVGLAGTENARWNSLSDQFEFILNEVYKDALKHDKDFWPAEYAAAMLLLEKYNRREGLPALENVLKINASAAEAYVGKGVAALQKLELKIAEREAEHALKLNPRLPDALRLRADVHLASGDVAAALKELEKARKVNPRDEETLGRIAACYRLQGKVDDFEALVKEVEKRDKAPATFYFELAQRLDERRRFDDAETHYLKAVKLRPFLAGPRAGLAMLYMRLGREKDASGLLDKAFEADPFNVRVSNTRKVLKHLAAYETIKTDHFELRYDPKNDPALARYMAEYLEDTYDKLAKRFQYRPKGPILIELFNNHTMFSGRVVALPDLHTIGACTGRMVAMVSPNGKGPGGGPFPKPFNWGRVVRHELVHIFNLEQTHFLVPHWFTEGLAVINEGYPRPQEWNQLLLERVPKGDLYSLENIDMGFMRPKRMPEDWHMAYCQAQLYVEYMTGKYGQETIGELLAAYADGLDTGAAISKVCKVDRETFESGYKAYLEGVVKTLKGKPAEKPMTFAELKKAREKDPDNADVAARLAEKYLLRKETDKAGEHAEAALAKDKSQQLAALVMARLKIAAGKSKQAVELMEMALNKESPEPKILLELGKIYYNADQFDKAAEIYELGRKTEPYDNKWLLQLVRVYTRAENKDKQIAVLKALTPTDADDLEHRRRLAKLLVDAGRFDEAERFAREALEIDIRDKEARQALYRALKEQNKKAEADKLRKLLEK